MTIQACTLSPQIQHDFLVAAQKRDLDALNKMINEHGGEILKSYGSVDQTMPIKSSFFPQGLEITGNALVHAITGNIFDKYSLIQERKYIPETEQVKMLEMIQSLLSDGLTEDEIFFIPMLTILAETEEVSLEMFEILAGDDLPERYRRLCGPCKKLFVQGYGNELFEMLPKFLSKHSKKHQGFSIDSVIDQKLIEIAKLLISKGCDVNQPSKTGFSPLHCAFRLDNYTGLKVGEILLEAGSNPSSVNKEAEIPVELVKDKDVHLKAAQLCAKKDPEFKSRAEKAITARKEKNQLSEWKNKFMIALQRDKLEKIQHLMQQGFDPSKYYKTNQDGTKIPLIAFAIIYDKSDIFAYLLEAMGQEKKRAFVKEHEKILISSSLTTENPKITEILLANGCDPNYFSDAVDLKDKGFIWHIHALFGRVKIVELYLRYGADIHARSQGGWTLEEYLQPDIYPQWQKDRERHYEDFQHKMNEYYKRCPMAKIIMDEYLELLTKYSHLLDLHQDEEARKLIKSQPKIKDQEDIMQLMKSLREDKFVRHYFIKMLQLYKKARDSMLSLPVGISTDHQQILQMIVQKKEEQTNTLTEKS